MWEQRLPFTMFFRKKESHHDAPQTFWDQGIGFRLSEYALALTIVFLLTVVASQAAQAQYTYTELHNFTGGQDGANPEAGLTME